jgi:hypothetical protein
MSANTSPLFTLTPHVGHSLIQGANTNRDGTGTVYTLLTGATNGTRIEYIRVVAVGTVTNGAVRIYINTGSAAFLWKEIIVTATTPSVTQEVFNAEYVPTKPLILPSGFILEASTNNAEAFNVFAHAGDY